MSWQCAVTTLNTRVLLSRLGHRTISHVLGTNLVTVLWLFVIFGEHQVVAQLIVKRALISPLINKDFPVRHPLLAPGNFTSVNLNHQKCGRALMWV
jgi:hypothetical protein